MTTKGTTFCRIIKVETETSMTGDERWVLTHICGKVEKRLRRKRGTRHERKAPNKVKCQIEASNADRLRNEYRAAGRSKRSEMWMMYIGMRPDFDAIDHRTEE